MNCSTFTDKRKKVLSARCVISNIDLAEVVDIDLLEEDQFQYRIKSEVDNESKKPLRKWGQFIYTTRLSQSSAKRFITDSGKNVAILDDIIVLTHRYGYLKSYRTYVFDLTQNSIFPFSYTQKWARDVWHLQFFTSATTKKDLGDRFFLKSFKIDINFLYIRQNRKIKFNRVVCEGCEQGFTYPQEKALNLEGYEYPKLKTFLGTGNSKVIEQSKLEFEKMSVDFFKQGNQMVSIKLNKFVKNNVLIELAYMGVIIRFCGFFRIFYVFWQGDRLFQQTKS